MPIVVAMMVALGQLARTVLARSQSLSQSSRA